MEISDIDNEEDRISNLPEFIIHQILSHLPPKQAAQTTSFSKTWLQSYSTSPILTFNEAFFDRSSIIMKNRYPFFNFVNSTLLRYTRLNLRIQKLVITVSAVDHAPAYRILLDESLGVAFDDGVQELDISVKANDDKFTGYTLPSAMFDSHKLLNHLSVKQCKFPENVVSNSECNAINFPFLNVVSNSKFLNVVSYSKCNAINFPFLNVVSNSKFLNVVSNSKCNAINFPFLKTLNLCCSCINDHMLQKLLSGSPLIEKIVFFKVFGFEKFRVTKLGKLRSLNITSDEAIVIDVEDAPSLNLLTCWGPIASETPKPCLLKVGCSLQSLNLKRLELCSMSISDNSLKDIITKSPLLEDLRIEECDELEWVYILSNSLKHLDFQSCKMLVEATIDAPNLLKLCYSGKNMLSLSLTSTPDELQIKICIGHLDFDHLDNAWFNQLRELLKAVNQTRVYFRLFCSNQFIELNYSHDSRENALPLEYQHHQTQNFMPINHSSSWFAAFVETFFSISRPATIDTPGLYRSNYSEFVKFLRNELMTTTRNPDCCSSDQTKCWRHYLKNIKFEVYEDSQELWHPLLRETSLSKFLYTAQSIRFSLEWNANLNVEV